MLRRIIAVFTVLCISFGTTELRSSTDTKFLSSLTKDQLLSDFRVANLYSDPDGKIVAAKFWHVPTRAPVFVLQIETVPQAFAWIDAPENSGSGLAHSLEHLVDSKGTRGRYFQLLKDMRLGQSSAATVQDFNYYGLSSATGIDDFFGLFHAWLTALYKPDFTDTEAEREFYHFGVATDSNTGRRTLVEQGSVYNEMQTGQHSYDYYFDLRKRVLGEQNPLSSYSGGLPDEMRMVTPSEIRTFHAKNYRLGPTTGFIFALDPKENIPQFLQHLSGELQRVSDPVTRMENVHSGCEPKYPLSPSSDTMPRIYSFPGPSENDPGEVRFSWKSVKTESPTELKLLQLFFRGLAQGERSLLYKSLVDRKTRELDTGATTIVSEPFFANSPCFPVWNVGISGIPGNQISPQKIEQIERVILATIQSISQYGDGSDDLKAFNRLIASYSKFWQRTQNVWIKNPPGFSVRGALPNWKTYLESLETDSSFVRSISEEAVWHAVDTELASGHNVWRGLIERFRLLDPPYAAGSIPSSSFLQKLEKEKQKRINDKLAALMSEYHTTDTQAALARFEEEERAKTKEIDQIQAKVVRPRFTEHPPLTWDDGIRYRQFHLGAHVPAIASIFDRPPTIDVGLSFDLHQVPRQFYKYFPLLPRSFDSLGLKEEKGIVSYSELLSEIRSTTYGLSVDYELDAISKRADLTFRASGANAEEFRSALNLIRRMMQASYVDVANVDRLRDIVDQRLSYDNSFTKQPEEYWISDPAYSLLHQDDVLFLALNSQFTATHWDWRLKWLLHKQVTSRDVERLDDFVTHFLASSSSESRRELTERLAKLDAKGLEGELVEYWKRNLFSFPDAELTDGFRRLAVEVEEDLRTGPARTVEDLKELQRIVLNQRTLSIDLTLSQSHLDELQPGLTHFLESLPSRPLTKQSMHFKATVTAHVARRYHLTNESFPWFVGFVDPSTVTGDVIFYADFPGFSQLDRRSLIRVLSSKIISGLGPQSVHMKTSEAGLAYSNSITSDPAGKFIWYYADRIPDVPALIHLVNLTAEKIPEMHDPFLVDYALRQTFWVPRSVNAFAERGEALARDIRNGNPPDKIRRFSEAVLKLRQDPGLLQELTHAGWDSICGILLEKKCEERQKEHHSIFFFIGSEKILNDTEKRLHLPQLLRIWPSDYWVQ